MTLATAHVVSSLIHQLPQIESKGGDVLVDLHVLQHNAELGRREKRREVGVEGGGVGLLAASQLE